MDRKKAGRPRSRPNVELEADAHAQLSELATRYRTDRKQTASACIRAVYSFPPDLQRLAFLELSAADLARLAELAETLERRKPT